MHLEDASLEVHAKAHNDSLKCWVMGELNVGVWRARVCVRERVRVNGTVTHATSRSFVASRKTFQKPSAALSAPMSDSTASSNTRRGCSHSELSTAFSYALDIKDCSAKGR